MFERHRIYLDNAATSWPKPQAVYEAVDDYQRRLGAAVGRGGYAEAEEAGKAVDEVRAAVSHLIGAEGAERVIFTFNGTDSLNLAIHGILRPGDHIITSVAEHNSVLRPLRSLEKNKRNQVTHVGCNDAGVIDPDDVRAALRSETKLIILTHASNVTGAIQPVSEIGQIARERGVLFLVDAAQTIGHMPVSVAELRADLLAAPGHKGLLGPLGTGILYIRPGVEEMVNSVRQGGTGSSSSDYSQPESLPEKYESGNHNVPGILGLGAAVRYIEDRGVDKIRRHSIALTDRLLRGLSEIRGVEIFGPKSISRQIGVVSFSMPTYDPPTIAKVLDDEYSIQSRAGFQCAALMHRSLGTLENNGTVRLSVGPFNSEDDIEFAIASIASLNKRVFRHKSSKLNCPCVIAPVNMAETAHSTLSEIHGFAIERAEHRASEELLYSDENLMLPAEFKSADDATELAMHPYAEQITEEMIESALNTAKRIKVKYTQGISLDRCNFDLVLVPVEKVQQSQFGEYYDNSYSRNLSTQLLEFNGTGRIEDYRPIIVNNRTELKILDGNHRHAAHRFAGLKWIPALVPRMGTPVSNSAPALHRRAHESTVQILDNKEKQHATPDITVVPGLSDLWRETLGDSEVCIAVLDGPVDLSHPCFDGARISALVPSQRATSDLATQHGTHVASVIFGQHHSQIKGIAPACRGISIPIFRTSDGSSFEPCSQVELANAISQAVDSGANIISISGGQLTPAGTAHPILSDAVEKCIRKNVLIVAAAGNQGCECLHVPGAIPSVLAVGAMNLSGDPLDFSNWGYGREGVLALGEGIRGATVNGKTAFRSGTSFATPIVSGLCGLLMSLVDERRIRPSANTVRLAILKTALDCQHQKTGQCDRLLAGRINVSGAFKFITKGNLNMTNPSENPYSTMERPAVAPAAQVGGSSLKEGIEHSTESNLKEIRNNDSPTQHAMTFFEAPGNLVAPAACGCNGQAAKEPKVFAIGRIGFDFGSEARRNSLQKHQDAVQGLGGAKLDIDQPANLGRHLRGWKETYKNSAGKDEIDKHKGHMYDADAFIWVLSQDGLPRYAVHPSGSFAEETHSELTGFLLEQAGFDSEDADALDVDWTNPGNDPLGYSRQPRTQFVAIPGKITGSVQLLSGHVVPVINPDMRGTSEWSIEALEQFVAENMPDGDGDANHSKESINVEELVRRILDRFSEELRNDGTRPEDRARNYGATQIFPIIMNIMERVQKDYKLKKIEIDNVDVDRSEVQSTGFELFDFSISLFDPSNVYQSTVVVSMTVDVSDVVPATVGSTRIFARR